MSFKQSDMLWMLLEKKIRATFVRKGDLDSRMTSEACPKLCDVLQLETPKVPPHSVIRTLIQMCRGTKDYKMLATKYPVALEIVLPGGNLIIHKIARMGYKEKASIEEIIMKGVEVQNRALPFGGITTKNEAGVTPVMIIYGFVVYHARCDQNNQRWRWLCLLLQNVAYSCLADKPPMDLNNYKHVKELNKQMPLLHAALELGCPFGLMNMIFSYTTVEELCKRDFLGRTALVVALANPSSFGEVLRQLFRRTPTKALELLSIDTDGDLPLHRLIKSGIKYQSKQHDIVLIGSFVEEAPQCLHHLDNEFEMPPFMLASIGNAWSLEVVYGLLRTGPWAIEPFA
jgi:hypothetical protein